jgi:hypothetical protein
MLRGLVKHYYSSELWVSNACPINKAKQYHRVLMVYIVWSNPNVPIPSDIADDTVVIEAQTESLNQRLRPIKELYTQAVFIADDDMLYRMDEVDFAFKTWQIHPNSAVGFFGRYRVLCRHV